jgi:hypothetical protein
MSFVCHFCCKPTLPGVPAKKIVTAYRECYHPYRPKASQKKVEKNGKWKMEWVPDPGGFGLQIAKEVYSCPQCAADWEKQQKIQAGVYIEKVVVKQPEPSRFETAVRRPYRGPQKHDKPPRTNNSNKR